MTERLLFKTVWPTLRRGNGQVQFGISPGHAVVLDGLTEAEILALESLDGTREVPATLAEAGSGRLLALLREHGLIVETASTGPIPLPARRALALEAEALCRTFERPAQGYAALARRSSTVALVAGRGALPAAVTAVLRRAGVGRVVVGPHAATEDLDPPTTAASPPLPGLVVLAAAHAIDTTQAAPWARHGIPVLPVVLHGVEAVIGPVVVPGGPCLRCLDLTRSDLDPAWPALLGQLTPSRIGAGPEISGESSLVALAAAMAAMVGLGVLDGQPPPVGRSLEVALPWPRVRQRQWALHPRCHCTSGDASRGPGHEAAPHQARMAG